MSCRVVIADDVEALRVLWRSFLSEEPDVEVVGEAADGAAALDIVRRERPDVLVLDLSMPRIDGLEVIRAVAAEGLPTAIVVASGFAAARLRPLAEELGATSYFEKGRPVEELVGLVKQACAVVDK